MTRRLFSGAIMGLLLASLTAASAMAAKPDRVVIDAGSPEYEADTEAYLLEQCGFAIDVESSGHVIVHLFNGHPRLQEIDNYRLFETFSANGKSITVRPDAGPDRIWVGQDGTLYLALTGRSVTGSGVIGRTVVNLDTGELVSSHGRDVGDFLALVCGGLAPEG